MDGVGRVLANGFLPPNTGFNSFDDDIWILKLVDFTKKILFEQTRVRLVGVCFGHQIIGRALGQKVGRSEGGWEISVTPMQLTAKGKELFGLEEVVSYRLHLTTFSPRLHAYSLTGHPPNAPRRSLHLPTHSRTPRPLPKLPRSGDVREEASDYYPRAPGV